MEHIAGATLAERLKSGPLPVLEALQCAAQVADALDHAHRRGVVHRDLKPGNIVLTKSGAKLLDFGIAKLVHASSELTVTVPDMSAPTMTIAGTVVGTLHYMAPGELQGLEIDGRSDLFALGAVIYEMIIGAKAFDGKSQATIMAMIIGGGAGAAGPIFRWLRRLIGTVAPALPGQGPGRPVADGTGPSIGVAMGGRTVVSVADRYQDGNRRRSGARGDGVAGEATFCTVAGGRGCAGVGWSRSTISDDAGRRSGPTASGPGTSGSVCGQRSGRRHSGVGRRRGR